MKRTYRVEAYIVPRIIDDESKIGNESSSSNEIDDVKVANKLKLDSPIKDSNFSEHKNSQDTNKECAKNSKFTTSPIAERIYDVPFCGFPSSSRLPSIQYDYKFESYDTKHLPKIPSSTSSLTSIDERGETDGILEEFCFHGFKDGCTAPVQRPEEVSEEIFKKNWLRRLQSLREREAELRNKETLLQERERLLFKKERELRILERLVKEKHNQAESYLKMCKSTHSIDSADTKTKSDGSRETRKNSIKRSSENFAAIKSNPEQLKIEDPLRYSHEEQGTLVRDPAIARQSTSSGSSGFCDEKYLKNPPNSISSLTSNAVPIQPVQAAKSQAGSTTMHGKSSAGFSGHGSLRFKPRPKISYDDLNSTLSADVGDSSYVVTSRKFDPEVFKKPLAFTRTLSERRTKSEIQSDYIYKFERGRTHHTGHRNVVEAKVLKRFSENLLGSQDKSTKYQNYGLIDPSSKTYDSDGARQTRSEHRSKERDVGKGGGTPRKGKERPISWNEESNEWLQKKRQAYNMATRRGISTGHVEDKENLDRHLKDEKADGQMKKKSSKSKKFNIFR